VLSASVDILHEPIFDFVFAEILTKSKQLSAFPSSCYYYRSQLLSHLYKQSDSLNGKFFYHHHIQVHQPAPGGQKWEGKENSSKEQTKH